MCVCWMWRKRRRSSTRGTTPIARTYRYQISTRRTAFFKKFVWWVKEPLDIAAMSRAARMLIGRHNFSAFRAEDKSRPDESPIVVVEDAGIEAEGDLIVFHITASHFVWRMVRRVVGALVKLGLGKLQRTTFPVCWKVRTESKLDVAAWTAPASGLFLDRVIYPETGVRRSAKLLVSRGRRLGRGHRERHPRPRR